MHNKGFVIPIILTLFFSQQIVNTNSISQVGIESNQLTEENPEFGVTITYVGLSPYLPDKQSPVSANLYQISSNLVFTPITLKFDISGWTEWNLGEIQFPLIENATNFGNQTHTLGQLFLQVNDVVQTLDGSSLSDFGYTISIPQGDHTISILYIGMGDEGIVYATDEVIIRIKNTFDEFDPYISNKIPFNSEINTFISEELAFDFVVNTTSQIYYRFEPQPRNVSTSLGRTGDQSTITRETSMVLNPSDIDDTRLVLKGDVDVTGFSGNQLLGSWEPITGILLLIDAAGMQLLSDSTDLTLRNGDNFVGILILTPAGLWHRDTPCMDEWSWCGGENFDLVDWEQLDEVAANPIFDSSFDFGAFVDGISFAFAVLEDSETTTTEESTAPIGIAIGAIFLMVPVLYKKRRGSP